MAAAGAAPMQVDTLVELASLGIPPTSMAFTHVTMQSEKYICVRETGAANNVVIIETANPSNPMRRPITADSAILAHNSKVIALKAYQQDVGDSLQVFNLDTKSKLKTHTMANEKVVFWTWLNDSVVGLITDTAAYHWDMRDADAPKKMFDRTANLNGAQIISYKVSSDDKWCTLVGIAPGAPERPQLVKGFMQLYSVEQSRSQALEAHTAAFSTLQLAGATTPVIAFTTKNLKDGAINSKVHVIALGGAHKKQAELFFPEGFADDFPVSLQMSEKFGLVYVVTKMGLLFVYDLENLTAIYRSRISADPIFMAQSSPTTGGLFVTNRRGTVLSVNVNPSTMVPFIANSLKSVELAIKVATKGNLPGAEALFVQQFEQQYNAGQHKEAAETAAQAPGGILRTQATITRLQKAPTQPGQKSPLLVYFGLLLTPGPLNAVESVEMARLVISQNRKEMLGGWLRDNKLTASEQLGDLIKDGAGDAAMALQVYKACGASKKEVLCHAETGDIGALIAAAGSVPGQKPDYMYLLQSLMMSNPAGAVGLAKGIVKQPGPPIDKATIANLFLQRQMYQEATAFLLDALEADLPEDGPLQTKLVEVNLMVKPDVADAILSNGTFSHYDRPRIAQLCEKAGLYMRALQHYSDLTDIKRCIVNTHAIDPAALTEYFGSLSSEWGLECLSELLHTNPTQNIPLVVNIAKEYTDAMGVSKIIALFEEHNSYQGLFMYLGARIAFSEDEEEHYKYIEAAAKCNQIREVERMTRESNFLPAQKVKGFLMDAKLPDARPLINICDRFNMVNDLTTYLYTNNMIRYIEGYVQKVNPAAAPQVVGGLLDCQAADDFISNLIMSVRSLLPVAALCEEVEKRNRLKLLTPFLELLVGEGSTDPEVHNAMGKILIDTNNNPEHFLQQNPYYNAVVVGKYCEKRDPHLACVAFKRGECDDELIDCTNRNSLFKLQARYLVERQNMDVYEKVLSEENPHRRAVVDQLVSTALPESKHPELVSCCVKAFMRADLQSELIELLEKIVLQNSAFSSNANLQNLLIITAIKSDPTRVLDYIRRLEGFEPIPVAEVALEFGQFDAAFEVYRKSGRKVDAVSVLLERMDDVTRAHEYATKVDDVAVWSVLGHAQLQRGLVSDAIGSYLLAKDSSKYIEVIKRASETQQYADLVKYLMMVRKKVKDQTVDSEIVIAYAKTAQLGELENFISGTHQANLQVCGDRCFHDALYESARILFGYIPNYGKLASCLVHLKRFQEAVDAARKAASPLTWKEVCFACVVVGEFKLAQLCGLNIIVATDALDEVSEFYQVRGHFLELIALLESGIGLERAHMGIFSELGMMFANHLPAKLMEHLKLFATRLNIPRLIRTCEQQQLYSELTFLYVKYDEYDNALNVMMQHGPDAWEHVRFKDVAVKCSSVDIFYKAISHYLDYHPELLSDLIKVLEARIDHSRVVDILRRSKHLPLVKEYLVAVQKNNLPAVNEALNELMIDEEDFEGLRTSIEHYDNFDQLQMAAKLEDHELTEFRRIAGFIYKRNLKWRKAVEMAKKDELMKDAMEIASQSGEPDLVEDLLRFFTDTHNPECFSACLYTCYDLVKPDVAVELAWCNGLMDLIMPFLIQFLREYTSKVDLLMSERKELQAAAQDTAADAAAQEAQRNAYAQLMPLALPAPPSANIPAYQAGPNAYGMPPGPYM